MRGKIIAFVGMPGSGKGTCTTYLADTYGFPVLHFGNMVYEEVSRRGLHNVKDEKFVREDMRAKEGPAVLAKHVAAKADGMLESETYQVIILDGLYSWTEYKYLRDKYGENLVLVATVADKQVRYRRILERKDSHRKYDSVKQIIDREVAEIENLEKGGPIAYADYYLFNNAKPERMLADLDGLLAGLRIKP